MICILKRIRKSNEAGHKFHFLLFVFFFFAAYAQNSEIDSLKKYISIRGDDSLKVNALIALSSKYLGSDHQEAMRCGYKALDLAEEIDFKKDGRMPTRPSV
jgi:hypothetical protein